MEFSSLDSEFEFAPPNDPWQEITDPTSPLGYMSFYHSDELSRYAVRDITRPNDNKSDPNIETMSYGLFSTCERRMRAGIVNNSRPHIFFVTRYDGERCLSGYYHVRWHTEGPPVSAFLSSGQIQDDNYLVADEMCFIHPPVPLNEIASRFDDEYYSNWFRTFKKTTEVQTEDLLSVLSEFEDQSSAYIEEIRRLERVNERFHNYRYTGWEQPESFSWEFAEEFLLADTDLDINELQAQYSSITSDDISWWECLNCGHDIESERPLKRCPNCNAIGTQVPGEGQ